jgi:glyoxylase-like metal-dependent hydrolase (beta-lactamase superfamily II)
MKKLTILLLFILIQFGCAEKQPFEYTSPNFDLIELADGVYACIHKPGGKAICNAGIIDNGEETIVFDSFLSISAAGEVLDIIEKAGMSPVRYLINSHGHYDHVRGNQAFPSDVDIISTKETAEMIVDKNPEELAAERQYAMIQVALYDSLFNVIGGDSTDVRFNQILLWKPYYEELADSTVEVKTKFPNLFVEDEKFLNGTKRRIQLIAKGHGHSSGDLVLYLPDDKILFTGDLVFNDMHPYMGQSSIEGWRTWLEYMGTLGIDKLIPGHGEIGNETELEEMRIYIDSVEKLAKELIEKEIPAEEIIETPLPEIYKDWSFGDMFASNLRFMYNRMTEQ